MSFSTGTYIKIIGKNAEAIGENGTLWALSIAAPCTRAFLRSQIRKKEGIDGSYFLKCSLFVN